MHKTSEWSSALLDCKTKVLVGLEVHDDWGWHNQNASMLVIDHASIEVHRNHTEHKIPVLTNPRRLDWTFLESPPVGWLAGLPAMRTTRLQAS